MRNNYILNKLKTIGTEDLPFLKQGLGVWAISLLNAFAHFLVKPENKAKGIGNGIYKRNRDFWIAQITCEGVNAIKANHILNELSELIGQALAKGEAVDIEEFGVFCVRRIPKHFERNIFTFKFHEVPEETEIQFQPNPKLLFAINFNSKDYDV